MTSGRDKRVVFVNQFFWPDEAATSQLLCDVTAAAGARVRTQVICGPPQYAPGPGSAAPGGVEIRRIAAFGFGHGKLRRVVSYASFVIGAARQVLRIAATDVILTMTTPPLLGLLGWVAQLRGARHYIWEMDLYPDVAVELGVFTRRGLLDRLTGWLADFPRRRADGIIALGPCMERRLRQRRIGSVPIFVIHNWADGDAIRSLPFRQDGRLKVFYSGNMGLAHDFATLIPSIRELNDGFLFRFSGAGPAREALEETCESLAWCEFGGYHPRCELEAAFAANDVGIVTQRPETVGTIVPSKVYGILAAGRAVIYVGPAESTVGRMIDEHGVGWRVANGDSAGLTKLLRQLRENPELVEEKGHIARHVFEREFDRRGQVEKIVDIIAGDQTE
ncbi:MAG: glycosyltransferase family 4 protein [Acidobacteria bacterium]|nr:glycosyltransferase family 4 protein [Acidobacteriota bacterium]